MCRINKKMNHDISKDDIIINVQCDEPFIKKRLKKLIFLKEKAEIGTIMSLLKTMKLMTLP